MKYLPLLGAFLLSSFVQACQPSRKITYTETIEQMDESTAYDGGYFEAKNYSISFRRIPDNEHMYAVSIIEPRSVKGENGFTVPSTLAVECDKGEAKGFVAMGADKSKGFMTDVLLYYLNEFCSRNGYEMNK